MTKLLITTTILLLATSSYGQKEGNIWYFGQNAGIDFNDSSAKAITNGAMYTSEGCATVCNDSGELLMYTDGRQVWNKNHQGMVNGGGLRGHISSSQSSIIVEMPDSDSLYYIFTVGYQGNTDGMRYSVVDMSLDSGRGAVTSQKNVMVVQPTCEKVTAIRHSNGRDYWIITHLYNSNNFNSYLLTSSGLDTSAVVSSLGMTISGFSKRTIGYLRPSRNGKRIAAAHNFSDTLELFNFDNSNGELSSLISLSYFAGYGPYGVAFSPNANVLYVATESTGGVLYQYDLSSNIQDTIINSRLTLNVGASASPGITGALQLAPDNKIYVARWYKTSLGVIENPDSLGTSCNYNPNGFSLGGRFSLGGLPNYPVRPVPQDGYYYTFTTENECKNDSVQFTLSSSLIDSVKWNFGDVTSGTNNYSSMFHPQHLYTNTGNYTVSVIVYKNTFIDTLTKVVTISEAPTISLPEDTTLCVGDSVLVQATSSENNYLWSTGETDSIKMLATAGQYWVSTENTCGLDTAEINLDFLELEVDLGNDSSLCDGDSLELNVNIPGATITWSNGNTTSTFVAKVNSIISVEVSKLGCEDADTMSVSFNALPTVLLGADTAICEGETLSISANNLIGNPVWSDGTTSNSISVADSGTYWVESTNSCGSHSDSIVVSVIDLSLELGNDFSLCEGDSSMVSVPFVATRTYLWSNYDTTNYTVLKDEGDCWLQIEENGCLAEDTIGLTLNMLPMLDLGVDSSLCYNEIYTVTLPTMDQTYSWYDGSSVTQKSFTTSGDYWVSANNACGSVSDTITLDFIITEANLGDNIIACEGDIVTIDGNNSIGNDFNWNTNSNATSITVSQEGIYWLEVVNGDCSARDSVLVTFNERPTVNLGEDFMLCPGEHFTLDVQDQSLNYVWQDNSNGYSYDVNGPGVYSVQVRDNNCVNSDTVVITESEDCNCKLEIPNAFSPNGDHINETFGSVYLDCRFTGYRLTIYNRWGEKLFETTDPDERWDGTYKGTDAQQTAYIYTLFYRSINEYNTYKKGTVTLLR